MNLKISFEKYYHLLLILSFLFLLISKSLAGTFYSTIFSVGLMGILFFTLIFVNTVVFKKSFIHALFWIYISLFIISLIRQYSLTDLSFKGLINVFLFFFTVIIVQVTAANKIKLKKIEVIKVLYYILNTYIYLNVICYLLGFVKPRYAGINSIFGLLNIHIDRVFFIFSPSLAYFAMICGVSSIVSLFLWLITKKRWYLLSLGVSLGALLLTDSRGPIFGFIIILMFIFIIRKFWIRNQLFFFLFFILSVSLFISVIFLVDTYLFDIDQLSRENATLLSWRDVIWEIFFENYKPSLNELLFGYGHVGQMISGISAEYEYLFANWPNPREISLHNNTLQMLVDVGLTGIVSFFTVLYYVVHHCIKQYKVNRDIIHLAIPAIINYILLLGFTDIIINISNVGIYFILMYVVINILYEPKEELLINKGS